MTNNKQNKNVTSRCSVLMNGASAFLTTMKPTGAVANAVCITDPLPEYLREWRKAKQDFLDADDADPNGGDMDCPACEKAEQREFSLEWEIHKTPATTFEGILAQLEYVHDDLRDNMLDGCDSASRLKMLSNMISTLKQLSA
ncbi:MAG: hypothetical protein JKX91_08615 [Rhizobiaceae bacterium]|nr:hypothetical protein [Rhizobiaceae bacterium]